MRIKILTDSTCDLPRELLEKYDITVVPLTVIKNEKKYSDAVDITPAEIFDHVAAGGSLCTTAALNIGEYQALFEKYAADYDGIVHINLGSGFSSCYQNACLAAEDFENIRVIDSRNLCSGQGLVALKAYELSQRCDNLDTLAQQLSDYTDHIESSFLLEQLAYMVKGGRCSSAAALGANLLNLKPCIEVKDGKMTVVKKYRGNYAKCLSTFVKERLSGREDLDTDILFVAHTPISEDCRIAVEDALKECANFTNIYWVDAGCTVSCHCGPGTLGLLFARK